METANGKELRRRGMDLACVNEEPWTYLHISMSGVSFFTNTRRIVGYNTHEFQIENEQRNCLVNNRDAVRMKNMRSRKIFIFNGVLRHCYFVNAKRRRLYVVLWWFSPFFVFEGRAKRNK
jgi:hypothetical protein